MPAVKDIVPEAEFGRWTVKSWDGGEKCQCVCVCGTHKAVNIKNILSGKSQSCGCWAKELTIKRCSTHGMAGRGKNRCSEYTIFHNMHKRCYDENSSDYHNYGGRGIIVEAEWHDFMTFFTDMGPRPSPSHSVDRAEVNGNYCKANCHWATPIEQGRNRRNNITFIYDGEERPLSEIAEMCGINYHTLHTRLTVQKLTIDEAISLPLASGGIFPKKVREIHGRSDLPFEDGCPT